MNAAPSLSITFEGDCLTIRQEYPTGPGRPGRRVLAHSHVSNTYGVTQEQLDGALAALGYVPISAVSKLTKETGLIHQWAMLNEQTKNLGLHITYGSWGFTLSVVMRDGERRPFDHVGDYVTLYELRAGISDWLKAEREAGRKI